MGEPLGLIAGAGQLPAEVARTARRLGRETVVVALRGAAESEALTEVGDVRWLPVGQIEAILAHFRSRGVRQAVMAGKVAKGPLLASPAELDLDERAIALLESLPDRSDASILGVIADTLAREGVELAAQADWVPDLVPGAGVLGTVRPNGEQLSEIGFGWPIAKAVAELDVGQTVVVKGRAVLAVEAIEGTDSAIERAGVLGGAGAVVVKVPRPSQDPRFDTPAFGIGTVGAMERAGARMLAFEADATLMLDRSRVVEAADAAGIALLGVPAEGPV